MTILQWAGPDSAMTLAPMLLDSDGFTGDQALNPWRSSTIHERSTPCWNFFDFKHGFAIDEAFDRFGPEAELAIIKRLDHAEREQQRNYVNVLKRIGTSRSISPLQHIVERGPFGDDYHGALDAIKVIRERTQSLAPAR